MNLFNIPLISEYEGNNTWRHDNIFKNMRNRNLIIVNWNQTSELDLIYYSMHNKIRLHFADLLLHLASAGQRFSTHHFLFCIYTAVTLSLTVR